MPDLAYQGDSNYELDTVGIAQGLNFTTLGPGIATSARSQVVGGFQSGLNVFQPPYSACDQKVATEAVTWTGKQFRRLGSGVVNDVDGSGNAVGDNERYYGEAGQPMLWRDSRAVLLSSAKGSAYGINRDGTIVGTIDGAAFIADAKKPHIQNLDYLLVDRAWHIIAAYAIADTGEILATAVRGSSGPLELVVLKPRPVTANEPLNRRTPNMYSMHD